MTPLELLMAGLAILAVLLLVGTVLVVAWRALRPCAHTQLIRERLRDPWTDELTLCLVCEDCGEVRATISRDEDERARGEALRAKMADQVAAGLIEARRSMAGPKPPRGGKVTPIGHARRRA